MAQFEVDEDLAALVERLANKRPFENITFSAALRRVLQNYVTPGAMEEKHGAFERSLAQSTVAPVAESKKAPTPNPLKWAATVPELKGRKGLNTWKSVCDFLKIDTGGDSARRKLKNWVKANRPTWPTVPDID